VHAHQQHTQGKKKRQTHLKLLLLVQVVGAVQLAPNVLKVLHTLGNLLEDPFDLGCFFWERGGYKGGIGIGDGGAQTHLANGKKWGKKNGRHGARTL